MSNPVADRIQEDITTNPVILQRAGLGSGDIPAVHDWAVAHGAQVVFLQTWGSTAEELAGRGHQLAALSERVVVKLPATLAGTTACARLAAEGVPTLLTAAHTVAHAVLAGAAGATSSRRRRSRRSTGWPG